VWFIVKISRVVLRLTRKSVSATHQKSDTRIYNASLLGRKCSAVSAPSPGGRTLPLAERATRYVINNQAKDGSWAYGTAASQSWVDNFHTAFVLFSLTRTIKACALGKEFQQAWNADTTTGANSSFLRTVGRNTTMQSLSRGRACRSECHRHIPGTEGP